MVVHGNWNQIASKGQGQALAKEGNKPVSQKQHYASTQKGDKAGGQEPQIGGWSGSWQRGSAADRSGRRL